MNLEALIYTIIITTIYIPYRTFPSKYLFRRILIRINIQKNRESATLNIVLKEIRRWKQSYIEVDVKVK